MDAIIDHFLRAFLESVSCPPVCDGFNDGKFCDNDEDQKESSFLGKFIQAAKAQKKMVTEKIYESRNRLAGIIEK